MSDSPTAPRQAAPARARAVGQPFFSDGQVTPLMPKRKLPPNDELLTLYYSGMSPREIGLEYACPAVTVDSALRRAGCVFRSVSEAQMLRVSKPGYEPTRFWLGKKQSPAHVESRASKIRGENHYLWKGGMHRRPYRQVVVKEQCERCGQSERLAIHHRDGDHYNNDPANLSVLCVACHSSTHKQAYWDAIHAGVTPARSNAPIGWNRG